MIRDVKSVTSRDLDHSFSVTNSHTFSATPPLKRDVHYERPLKYVCQYNLTFQTHPILKALFLNFYLVLLIRRQREVLPDPCPICIVHPFATFNSHNRCATLHLIIKAFVYKLRYAFSFDAGRERHLRVYDVGPRSCVIVILHCTYCKRKIHVANTTAG